MSGSGWSACRLLFFALKRSKAAVKILKDIPADPRTDYRRQVELKRFARLIEAIERYLARFSTVRPGRGVFTQSPAGGRRRK